ncbi:MAG: serine hydrolase domain-containing protein, partial [Gemmatimonadales bacterium]
MWLFTLTQVAATLAAAPAAPIAGPVFPTSVAAAADLFATTDTAAARRSKAVDALFTRWHTPDSPGASVAVIYDGQIVHAKGYGMASLEHGVPNQPHTVFDIASVSKQFGAFAIALLEGDGRLSLDDDVRKYVPELPDFGNVITIRHLVHHTSGLRDWPGTLRMGGWNFEDVMSFEQILRMAYRQTALNFKPNDEHAYSNTGYNVLAEVVQRVSGQTFRQFTEQRIFRPLGMTKTHFHDDHREVVRDVAESYAPDRDGNRGYLHVT